MKNQEGWEILLRTHLHLRQKEYSEYWLASMDIVTHCQRLILADEFPESENVRRVLAESTKWMAKRRL